MATEVYGIGAGIDVCPKCKRRGMPGIKNDKYTNGRACQYCGYVQTVMMRVLSYLTNDETRERKA